MGNRRTMTVNQNSNVTPWSDVNHDLLNSVMMRLGVVDFIAFSGVCKSWRSLALSNKNIFMASRPPMHMSISTKPNEIECYLNDVEGRKFKTVLPHSVGRTFVGLTCGYLILFGRKTNDFWLVNLITRHELHFSDAPFDVCPALNIGIRAILVFSPPIYGWVFVLLNRLTRKIWCCIAGKGAWNHVSPTSSILDLHAFKGKIYTLHIEKGERHVCEMRLDPLPKLTKLETKNILEQRCCSQFVRAGENLYAIQLGHSGDFYKLHELDFGEMKWVCREKTREDYAFFVSVNRSDFPFPEPSRHQLQYLTYAVIDKSRKGKLNRANMWYCPHDCLNIGLIHES